MSAASDVADAGADIGTQVWREVVNVELATFGELVRELVDEAGIPPDEADEIVEQAIDDGTLAENGESTFGPTYEVAPVGFDHIAEPVYVPVRGDDEDDEGNADADANADADPALDALAVAVEFFHEQLDRELPDSSPFDTPRDYFIEGRGWDAETIEDKRLGYAPADETALLDRLMGEGFERDAILGSGLFGESLKPIWRGRFVFPYFDEDGRPAYAISRTADHPDDWFRDQKYAKAVKSKDYSCVDEPIYGLGTIRDGEPLLITEGMADAISAHEAGYPCVSPVTTQFKHDDRERLLSVIDDRDVPRVYIVQDAEPPTSDVDVDREADGGGWAALNIEQYGEGLRGAVSTAAFIAEHGADARLAELPRPDLEKVDLDKYLKEWATDGSLRPILASAKPVDAHPKFDAQEVATEHATATQRELERQAFGDSADGSRSTLFDLDVLDVAGVSADYRGVNPLGHHGDSEDYCQPIDGDGPLYDHKYNVAYNAITFLLCEAGERSPASPNGSVSDRELFAAWRHAKREGLLPKDDPIPHRALCHLAVDGDLCDRSEIEDGWKLPIDAYNGVLEVVSEEFGLDSGREPLGGDYGEDEPGRWCVECAPPISATAAPSI